jgi:hypothetical protein
MRCFVTEGAIKDEQSRETGNIWSTRRRQLKHNTICAGHHYAQTNTIKVNKNKKKYMDTP